MAGARSTAAWSARRPRARRCRRRSGRAAAIVQLSGAVVVDEWRGVEPRLSCGEAIGFDDGQASQRGPRGVDRRTRRPRVQRTQGRGARHRPAHRRHDHRRHGRYAGIAGDCDAHLAVSSSRPTTATFQGRAVGSKGRVSGVRDGHAVTAWHSERAARARRRSAVAGDRVLASECGSCRRRRD